MFDACFNRTGLQSIAHFSFHTCAATADFFISPIVAAHLLEEKHTMDRKPVLLEQTFNKLEKYPYNKTQRSYYNF